MGFDQRVKFGFGIDFGLSKEFGLGKAVKRASPSGFRLILMGFGLNGPGQKSLSLNKLGKL